ncbi:putative 1 protein kinase [Rosellinia necatrix]|uniref:Putative 1 protein kinase n=1 Tax=Rosellinia necatrix TaxID=77044 RepID=A0A1S8A743_ROSNE|nr:putative 1 protein kinase [Rosellinia necatrix]
MLSWKFRQPEESLAAVPFHQLPHHLAISYSGSPVICRGSLTALEARGAYLMAMQHQGMRVMTTVHVSS